MSVVTLLGGGLTQERRTVEAYIHAPLDGQYHLTFYRQVVIKDADGAVRAASRDDQPIQKFAADIATLQVTVNGETYSGAEVIGVMAAFFDALDPKSQPAAGGEPAQ